MEIRTNNTQDRVIIVDEQVFRELQERAEPLVDDANSVLRRLLGIQPDTAGQPLHRPGRGLVGNAKEKTRASGGAGKKKSSGTGQRKRAPKGSLLPEADYEVPLLEALDELGGSGPASVVVNRVGEKLHGQLTAVDLERVTSGEVRWKNRVQFVRLGLVKAGLMKADSPRGTWEIAEAGRLQLRRTSGSTV